MCHSVLSQSSSGEACVVCEDAVGAINRGSLFSHPAQWRHPLHMGYLYHPLRPMGHPFVVAVAVLRVMRPRLMGLTTDVPETYDSCNASRLGVIGKYHATFQRFVTDIC